MHGSQTPNTFITVTTSGITNCCMTGSCKASILIQLHMLSWLCMTKHSCASLPAHTLTPPPPSSMATSSLPPFHLYCHHCAVNTNIHHSHSCLCHSKRHQWAHTVILNAMWAQTMTVIWAIGKSFFVHFFF